MRSPAIEVSPSGTKQRAFRIILVALLTLGALAVGMMRSVAAEAQAVSQCVACHTDAGKLQALTPPDPPASEEGEG